MKKWNRKDYYDYYKEKMDILNQEGPKITFREVKSRAFDKFTTLGGNQIAVSYTEGAFKKDITPEIRAAAKKLFGSGYDYLAEVVGSDLLGNEFGIDFSESWMALGVEVAMDTNELKKIASGQVQAQSYQMDLNVSTVIHEIAHSFEDEEGAPMLIEVAFMMENGHPVRVQEIQGYLEEGRLPPRYINGLKEISKWLGVESPSVLLKRILDGSISPVIMKSEFRKRVGNFVEEMEEEGL